MHKVRDSRHESLEEPALQESETAAMRQEPLLREDEAGFTRVRDRHEKMKTGRLYRRCTFIRDHAGLGSLGLESDFDYNL